MSKKSYMYLRLFHGHKTQEEIPEDWGVDGPIFGPITSCHTSYANELNIIFAQKDDKERNEGHLKIIGGLVYYDNMWYGDWSLPIYDSETKPQIIFDLFSQKKAEPVLKERKKEDFVENFSCFHIESIQSQEPYQNPFDHNISDMGTMIGDNICIMHQTFPGWWSKLGEEGREDHITRAFTIVHIPSGKILRVLTPEGIKK